MLTGVDLAPVGLAAYFTTQGGTTAAPQTMLAAFSLAASDPSAELRPQFSCPKSRTGWLYNQPAPYFLRLAAR